MRVVVAALLLASVQIGRGASLRGSGVFGRFVKSLGPSSVLDYRAIDTRVGLGEFLNGKTDFSVVDRALSRDELDQAGRQVFQLPVGISNIAIIHNIPGVSDGVLQLDSVLLGAIFSCEIRTWGDAAIRKLNPNLQIHSNATIVPLAYDSSTGASINFFRYLALESSWHYAANTKFPACMRSSTQAQAAFTASETPNSIAYVSTTANGLHLPRASLLSHAGTFMLPEDTVSPQGLPDSPVSADWAEVNFASYNSSSGGVYPIASFAYLLMDADVSPAGYTKAVALQDLAKAALSEATQANITDYGLSPIDTPYGSLVTSLRRSVAFMLNTGSMGDRGREKPWLASQKPLERKIQGAGDGMQGALMGTIITNLSGTLPNVSRLGVGFSSMGGPQGLTYVLDNSFDFSISGGPPPLQPDGRNFLAFPFFIAAARFIVNLPGLGKQQLQLSADTLAQIYSCGPSLMHWRHPAIVKLNPNITLPDVPIQPIGRLDDTDANFAVSQYLHLGSSLWPLGASTSLQWPSCVLSLTSDAAIAEAVQARSGTLGFIMTGGDMCPVPCVAVETKQGRFMAPSKSSLEGIIPKPPPNLTLAAWAHSTTVVTSDGALQPYPMLLLHLVYTDGQAGGSHATQSRGEKVKAFLMNFLSPEVQAGLTPAGFFPLVPQALPGLRAVLSQTLAVTSDSVATAAPPPPSALNDVTKGLIAATAAIIALLIIGLALFLLWQGRVKAAWDAESNREGKTPRSSWGLLQTPRHFPRQFEEEAGDECLDDAQYQTRMISNRLMGAETIASPMPGMRMTVVLVEDLPDNFRDSENPTAGEVGSQDRGLQMLYEGSDDQTPATSLKGGLGASELRRQILEANGEKQAPPLNRRSVAATMASTHSMSLSDRCTTTSLESNGPALSLKGDPSKLDVRSPVKPSPSSFGMNSTGGDPESVVSTLRTRALSDLGELHRGPLIGRGSFGQVYKCRWRGGTVALKVLQHNGCQVQKLCVLRESLLAANISHPNVLTTFTAHTILHSDGCQPSSSPLAPPQAPAGEAIMPPAHPGPATHTPPAPHSPVEVAGPGAQPGEVLETWLVSEFCDKGNLEAAIQSRRFEGRPDYILLCLLDIASGMEYMHSLGVLHADLKPGNVLLISDGVTAYDPRGFKCKLGDFGLSRVLENSSTHVSITQYGTLAFMPPEVLQSSKVNKATDVYSFSMIMAELWTGERVFSSLKQHQIMYKVFSGKRPKVDFSRMPASYARLLIDCWATNPSQRPDFHTIQQRLRLLYANMDQNEPPLKEHELLQDALATPGAVSGTTTGTSYVTRPPLGDSVAGTAGSMAGTAAGTQYSHTLTPCSTAVGTTGTELANPGRANPVRATPAPSSGADTQPSMPSSSYWRRTRTEFEGLAGGDSAEMTAEQRASASSIELQRTVQEARRRDSTEQGAAWERATAASSTTGRHLDKPPSFGRRQQDERQLDKPPSFGRREQAGGAGATEQGFSGEEGLAPDSGRQLSKPPSFGRRHARPTVEPPGPERDPAPENDGHVPASGRQLDKPRSFGRRPLDKPSSFGRRQQGEGPLDDAEWGLLRQDSCFESSTPNMLAVPPTLSCESTEHPAVEASQEAPHEQPCTGLINKLVPQATSIEPREVDAVLGTVSEVPAPQPTAQAA